MTTLREAAQEFVADYENGDLGDMKHYARALRAALAQKEQEPTVRYKCTVVDDRHPNGVPFEQWVNAPQEEPVAYTGDVARRMREAEMTFHLGMPHAVVMQQMTRFHDLVCAEASIKSAAAFDIPPRREWQGLTEEELDRWTPEIHSVIRAIEAKLKEKNA